MEDLRFAIQSAGVAAAGGAKGVKLEDFSMNQELRQRTEDVDEETKMDALLGLPAGTPKPETEPTKPDWSPQTD